MQFIQNNNIINTTQYGFLKKHNTTQATLDIYNHIMENKKENKAELFDLNHLIKSMIFLIFLKAKIMIFLIFLIFFDYKSTFL